MERVNPLINIDFKATPFGAYPFDQIEIADYLPAFYAAIEQKKQEIEAIKTNPEPPSFENTILALEHAGEQLEYVSGVFFNLLHSDSNEQLEEISREIIPQLSSLSTDIILDEELFARIKEVYDKRESLTLTPDSRKLLADCYKGFFESGAALEEPLKKRLRELSEELSEANLHFSQNLLKAQQEYKLYLTDESKLEGLPFSLKALAKSKAKEEGYKTGYLFDLSAPSYFPFMQHMQDRDLRREMYLKKGQLAAVDGALDNRPYIRTLVNGRLEEANILGYKNFAELALKDRMAKNPERVYQLLYELLEAYKPIAEKEIKEIEQYAVAKDAPTPLEVWDWSYWAERYKEEHYELSDELLRPYFELGQAIDSVFSLATRLYGIRFQERQDIPVYHKDVRVYEVIDEDESYLGLLYTDFFPRKGKQSGAWMNNLQEQYRTLEGADHRPHIVLVMNFTPPNDSQPSLLTLGEVGTFLHEFGHALHGLFSKVTYSSQSGTSVARDFVELPSQLMENWLSSPEWLREHARHYQTGEPIPEEYIQRLERARRYLVGYAAVRQLSFGLLDMAWHTIIDKLEPETDLAAFEYEAWKEALVLPKTKEYTMMSPSFSHIFSGGYASGYYGYKWAEVLDADAYESFTEHELYDRAVARRFRECILSQGDTREADELYKAFRGREASIEALLRRDGVVQ